MAVRYWRITGYKGKNDYDVLQDNNVDVIIAFDSRFNKRDVEDIMFFYWGKRYRSVAINAEPVESTFHDEVGEMIDWHKTQEEPHTYQIIEGEGIDN